MDILSHFFDILVGASV